MSGSCFRLVTTITFFIMTKKASLNGVIAFIFAVAVGMPSLKAQELSLSAEDMQYDANGASITLDGLSLIHI